MVPFVPALMVGGAAAAIDPVWATPVNTALLVLIALIGYLSNRKVERVVNQTNAIKDKADAIHEDVGNAASASASAAQAAADSARIIKEIGGSVRHVEPPTQS